MSGWHFSLFPEHLRTIPNIYEQWKASATKSCGGFFVSVPLHRHPESVRRARVLVFINKTNNSMKKIVIKNKEELQSLYKVFPSLSRPTLYRALSFQTKTVLASRIRCYAMNFLPSAQLLTTKD